MNDVKKIERRPVPGYEGSYSVTSDGVVYADARVIEKCDGKKLTLKERIKKALPQKRGTATRVMFYGYPEAKKSETISMRSVMQAAFPEMFPPVPDLAGEEWRTLSYNSIYLVSNLGRFKRKSCSSTIGGVPFTVQEYIMPTHAHVNTNRTISLRDDKRNYYALCAATLVYETFVGKIPDGQYIKYRDGDNTNLSLSNLYVGEVANRDHVVHHRNDKGMFVRKHDLGESSNAG